MSNNDFTALAEQLIAEFANSRRLRANALIITVYGDTICPYGGTIWLGSLIKLVEPLGISDRLVRTSVYRLSEAGVLESTAQGRRSYYNLSERGLRQFEDASRRFYAPVISEWDGSWQLIMIPSEALEPAQQSALCKELLWMGFSEITPGVFAHPSADSDAINTMLDDQRVAGAVIQLNATSAQSPKKTAATTANINNQLIASQVASAATEALYQDYLKTFQPILTAAQQNSQWNPELCFLVRTLLIHRYRHIVLQEPDLPSELLPDDSIGQQARQLTADLYALLSPHSDAHFLRVTETGNGEFKQPNEDYYRRFSQN